MKVHTKLALLTATVAFSATPAFALGAPAGASHKHSTPGPGASQAAKAKAYGKFCQGESKQHVAGTPGTAFSKCVTDMAKLAKGSTTSPRSACKNESKKHVAGEHGTPFSRCVSGGAKLLRQQSGGTSSGSGDGTGS